LGELPLTVTLGAGTSAVYGLTAAAPLSVIDSIVVNYGGPQHNFRPYILKYYFQMQGRMQNYFPRTILAGQLNTFMQAYYNSTNNNAFPVAVGANTWNFRFFVPMNMIHEQDCRGILPIQNGETTCQVVLNCAGAPQGPDPVLNTTYAVSGSGTYQRRDRNRIRGGRVQRWSNLQSTWCFTTELSGVQTTQLVRDTPLNNLGIRTGIPK
jgi:hypothetical protein